MEDRHFWAMVECTIDASRAEQTKTLSRELQTLSESEIESFVAHFDENIRLAGTKQLFGAATLINHGACSDDCFLYFRYWLVSRGHAVFRRALREPDWLSTISREHLGDPEAQFEEFGYVAAEVYERLSGRSLPRSFRSESLDFGLPTLADLKSDYPQLWRKYGKSLAQPDSQAEQSVPRAVDRIEVPGLGVIAVGSEIVHKRLGPGIVKSIAEGLVPIVEIQFPNGTRSSFALSSNMFVSKR
jgi:hypothetical protein